MTPDIVTAAKQRLEEGRAKLRSQHEAGSPGIQVCTRLTDLLDLVLLEIYEAVLEELGQPPVQNQIALVPHGGYGRADVAPYSDVDLMLLCAPEATEEVIPLARRLTQHIFDAGLDLGFSLRTPRQACQLALKDATIFTSLVESRYLAGSVRLFTRFANSFKRQTRFRVSSLIAQIEAARADEKSQYGDTVYLLRPNVKRTRGGLRDLQMVRWIGFVRYGEADPDKLERVGALLPEDRAVLKRSYEFLLRLRNELHFHAGRSQDVLGKHEQVRLAEKLGFVGDSASLPVEQFMQTYFEHTGEVRYRVAHFVAGAKRRTTVSTILGGLFSRRMETVYRIGPRQISATKQGLAQLSGDLEEVLQLMDLANNFNKRIDHATWQFIRRAMTDRPPRLTHNAARRFMSLLSQPTRLASLLRRLHQLRALEILVPPMTHARSRMQFNDYHKYTVDEHSLRAIEYITGLARESNSAGRAYRNLPQKAILHLAVLMHDLGKGFPEDHSELGAKLAGETARRLGLSDDDTATLQFLVLKHLRMAHLAFQHNLSDPSVIVQFAVEVGRPDWLRMLYVLTCADLSAVGPGVLNSWKFDLLTQLFYRTRDELESENYDPAERRQHQLQAKVLRLAGAKSDHDDLADKWWTRQLDSLPWGYYESRTAKQVFEELSRIRKLDFTKPGNDAVAWGRYLPDQQAVEYVVGTSADVPSFYRLTGALSSKGHQILRAEVHTLADGAVIDRYFVQDLDFKGEPPAERLDEVAQRLVAAAINESDQPPRFRRVWRSGEDHAAFRQMPTEVRIDNSTSARHTIISVLTYDRLGLLYAISRTLYDLQLQVGFAKIGTHVDQVVDVFYVTLRNGEKLTDPAEMERVREEVRARVEGWRDES
ncbi:MAG: [protein-PII] uridylyltransferase [Planctomycetales bacterium]|nr:[protein-PII] uridylyltransferase [Planctomycetales bacterium]